MATLEVCDHSLQEPGALAMPQQLLWTLPPWEKEIYTLISENGCTRQLPQCISARDIEKRIMKLSIKLDAQTRCFIIIK